MRGTVRKREPHAFVLEALQAVEPALHVWTHPMFGCLAVYVDERIVLILRDQGDGHPDDGVWLATSRQHHDALRVEFPHLRSISVLGTGVTGWQVLPLDAPDFETAALRACELIAHGDERIGKVPVPRKRRARG